MRTSKLCTLVSLCVLVLAAPAWAQQGRERRQPRAPRMRQLSLEQAEVAWQWEARSVGRDLKLDADQTARLVKAYVTSRKDLRAKLAELREDSDDADRRGRWRVAPDMIEKQRAALQTDVSAFLTEDQSKQAMQTLGAYSGQWDRMVDAVAGLKLGDDKTYAALAPINQYMIELSTARESGDRQAIRDAMMEAHQKLYDGLGAVLDEQQLAAFQGATGWRGPDRRNPQGQTPPAEHAATAAIGKPAPAFELKDSKDRTYTLADYRGKIVVLEWVNPDCPVCRRTFSSGKVAAMRKQLESMSDDVVHLAINSTYYMEPAAGTAYVTSYHVDVPVLSDRDGTVGHLYGAAHTPHMFVIDAEGILRYAGAFDDDARGDKGDAATNYVVQAVGQILAGETVSPDRTQAYGCSVKYAPKK
jgi:peroxiredoxin